MKYKDVNPMMGANMLIAGMLAKRYGSDSVEHLYLLLSDPEFAEEIKKLREKYGIKIYSSKVADVSAQQFIAECVATTHGANIKNIDDFEQYYGEFHTATASICKRYNVPKLPIDLIDQYVVRGDAFLTQQFAHNLIKVHLNKDTKELTIRLDARTKKRDLLDVLAVIYKSWDMHRSKVPKKQPATAASLHSQIVRYTYENTEKQTAKTFNQTEENVHKIKMRTKKQRNKLLKNNDTA